MNITFGIITAGNNDHMLSESINSIHALNIPKYEIIVVGGTQHIGPNVTNIPFDESVKHAWVTKKKNLITEHASFDNIVYAHDFIYFDNNWYNGFLSHGDDFNVCMNVILNADGSRFRDWTLWTDNGNHADAVTNPELKCLLPYNVINLSKFMYISGSYWVAKKKIMEEYPLNEELSWAEGEDVEWSKLVREKHEFSMNPNSTVRLLKYKPVYYQTIPESDLNIIYKGIKC